MPVSTLWQRTQIKKSVNSFSQQLDQREATLALSGKVL